MFCDFLDYRAFSGRYDIMQMSITQLARLEAWVATVPPCLEQREKRGKHRQKVYADAFKSHATDALNQLIRHVRTLLQISDAKSWNCRLTLNEVISKRKENRKFYVT